MASPMDVYSDRDQYSRTAGHRQTDTPAIMIIGEPKI